MYTQGKRCTVGPVPSIHQVSDGIKHTMHYHMVNIIHRVLHERVGPKAHLISVMDMIVHNKINIDEVLDQSASTTLAV